MASTGKHPFAMFKNIYRDRKTGKRVEADTYSIRFRDHLKRRQTLAAEPDERDSITFGNRIMHLVRCRRECESLPSDVAKWLDTIDTNLRARLMEMEIIDARAMFADKTLLAHLEGEKDSDGAVKEPGFEQALRARGNSEMHISTTIGRVKKLIDGCGLVFWKDLVKPGVSTRIEVWLGDRRTKGEIGGKTINYFIRDLKSFCKWLAETDRAPSMALATLKPVNNADVDTDRRRALSGDEMRWLLATAHDCKLIRDGMTGEERELVYRFGFETGIRPGQMRSLKVSDFDLSKERGTVTTQAQFVKRRRRHEQQLTAGMTLILKAQFANRLPAAAAFHMGTRMSESMKADLLVARQSWIEVGKTPAEKIERAKSDFLADVNQAGERAVFYSVRHGHGTALAEAGVPEKDIAASMHHASRTTTARYLHSDRKSLAAAVAALPDLDYSQVQLATGTD